MTKSLHHNPEMIAIISSKRGAKREKKNSPEMYLLARIQRRARSWTAASSSPRPWERPPAAKRRETKPAGRVHVRVAPRRCTRPPGSSRAATPSSSPSSSPRCRRRRRPPPRSRAVGAGRSFHPPRGGGGAATAPQVAGRRRRRRFKQEEVVGI